MNTKTITKMYQTNIQVSMSHDESSKRGENFMKLKKKTKNNFCSAHKIEFDIFLILFFCIQKYGINEKWRNQTWNDYLLLIFLLPRSPGENSSWWDEQGLSGKGKEEKRRKRKKVWNSFLCFNFYHTIIFLRRAKRKLYILPKLRKAKMSLRKTEEKLGGNLKFHRVCFYFFVFALCLSSSSPILFYFTRLLLISYFTSTTTTIVSLFEIEKRNFYATVRRLMRKWERKEKCGTVEGNCRVKVESGRNEKWVSRVVKSEWEKKDIKIKMRREVRNNNNKFRKKTRLGEFEFQFFSCVSFFRSFSQESWWLLV